MIVRSGIPPDQYGAARGDTMRTSAGARRRAGVDLWRACANLAPTGAWTMLKRLYLAAATAVVLVGFLLLFWRPPSRTIDLDQGWTAGDLRGWRLGNQGSRMVPYAWLLALEQPDGSGMFLDKDHMEGFRYLAGDKLPVGFALDVQDDRDLARTSLRWKPNQGPTEPWVGLTCSACHTTEITFKSHTLRIEGGATLADFQAFRASFVAALGRTVQDPDSFRRFSDRVLAGSGVRGGSVDEPARAMLRAAVASLYAYHAKIEAMDATTSHYGFGRLDAVGHIYNKTAFVAQPANPTANPSDAPVSYPFLWNIGQQKLVEWNGVGSNTPLRFLSGQTFDVSALGRNVGEVTGVFGDVATPDATHRRYRVSHRLSSIVALEQQLDRLRPPRWPRELWPIDALLAAEGKVIYAAQCASCHFDLRRTDLKTHLRPDGTTLEQMSYLQPRLPQEGRADTDPWMACNAALAEAATGGMKGQTLGKTVLGDRAPLAAMLTSMITTILTERVPALAANGAADMFGLHAGPEIDHSARARRAVLTTTNIPPVANATRRWAFEPERPSLPGAGAAHRQARWRACQDMASAPATYRQVGYKARPLTGVWATAPYLHNGSVPTLHDLLLPPDQRPTTFHVGDTDFDPDKVGYVTSASRRNSFVFQVKDAAGAVIPGNSNEGHDFGASGFTDRQREALLEYLKVAGE